MSKRKNKDIWYPRETKYDYDKELKMDGYDWGTKYVSEEEFVYKTTMDTILACYREYMSTMGFN